MRVIKLLVLRQLSTPLKDLNAFAIIQQIESIWKATIISFLSMDEEIKIKGCSPDTENESIGFAAIPHQEDH